VQNIASIFHAQKSKKLMQMDDITVRTSYCSYYNTTDCISWTDDIDYYL